METSTLKKWFVLLFSPLLTIGQSAYTKSDYLHYYSSAGITIVSGVLAYQIKEKPLKAKCVGISIGLGLGIAKEFIWDKALHKGQFSKRDLFYDATGTYGGFFCLNIYIENDQKRKADNLSYVKLYYDSLNVSTKKR